VKGRVDRWLPVGVAWNWLYRSVSYLRSALWVAPIVAVFVSMVVFFLLHFVEQWVTWDVMGLGVDGARAMFQTIINLTLSFVVFTFGSLLVAIQVASGQLTPRIIATTLLRDRVIKYQVGLVVFTMIFAIIGLNRTEDTVNQLTTLLGSLLGVASLASFLFMIDYTARLLRPVQIVALVCDQGIDVVEAVYPEVDAEDPDAVSAGGPLSLGEPARVVAHAGRSQIVLAVEIDALVSLGAERDGVIEVVPQVGDFVAADEPLFRLYGGAAGIGDATLRNTVAFGPERTMEQDPMFSFRILVDIALKALSPAINDPTTAVLAMDQIHRLLRVVGRHRLHDDTVHDAAGRARLILRTPNWADFVHIACSEIRACGADSVQVARRMRAMLENLISTLPEQRHAVLRQELELLDRTLPGQYGLPEDLALARVPDAQGLGGASGHPQARGGG
jgi:uncharacterized membrane protein